jgi:ubiquinone biosynthesis protein UbiJ
VAAGLRAGAEQMKVSAGSAGDMLSEYLQRSQGPVVRADEVEDFTAAVDEVSKSAERLAARIRKIKKDPA